MTEREVRCVHCQIYVVATLTGEWEGADVDILGPVVCDACTLCLREKGVRCQSILEAALGAGGDA